MSFNPFLYYGYVNKAKLALLFGNRAIISDKVDEDTIGDWIALNPHILTLIKRYNLEI